MNEDNPKKYEPLGDFYKIQESKEAFNKFLRNTDLTGVHTISGYKDISHFVLEMAKELDGFACAQDSRRQRRAIEIDGISWDNEKAPLSIWNQNKNSIKIYPLRIHLTRHPEPMIVITPEFLDKSSFGKLAKGDSVVSVYGKVLTFDLTRPPYNPLVILPYGSELLKDPEEFSPYEEKPKVSKEIRRAVFKDFLESL